MRKRKSTSRAKLKAVSHEERLKKWKEHFKNRLGNPPEVTDKPFKKFINSKLDVQLQHFTEEELNIVLKKKLKSEKFLTSTKYLLKYGRQENLMTYFFDYAILAINKTYKRKKQKAASSSSPIKVSLESLRTIEA